MRALCLAIPATAAAVFLSVLAGMQRGGLPSERVAWVAIGVLLTVAAHLLPALCRDARLSHRIIGVLIWFGCMAATCYGHAVFFLMAQQHAGALRADAVVVPASVEPTGRDLGAIAADRAAAVADLMARCRVDCTARRATIRARIDALGAEAGETRRREAAADRVTVEQDRAEHRIDGLRADPVTGRLAAVTGIPASTLDLLAGMLCALTLEGVACLYWALALDSTKQPHGRDCGLNPMNVVSEPGGIAIRDLLSADEGDSSEPVTEPVVGDRGRVAAEIAAGRVRCTVADIRRYLGCSQTRALELRRQLIKEEA
jgi:hypothetical protein